MMNDIQMSAVEKIESKTSIILREWLEIPPSLFNIGIYGRAMKVQSPFNALTYEFKVIKAQIIITI